MSKAKIETVQQLIAEKRYDVARALLETMDDPEAREWLAYLDELAPVNLSQLLAPSRTPDAEPVQVRKKRRPLWQWVVIAVLGCGALYYLTGGPQQAAQQNATRTADAAAAQITSEATQTSRPLTSATATFTAPPTNTLEPSRTVVLLTTDTLIARLTAAAAPLVATPTDTATAANTLTPTETPRPTDTSVPTSTLRPTNTPRPAPTRTPSLTTYYINAQFANVRVCPRADCALVTQFFYGDAIEVIGTVQGQNTQGSADWREVLYNGQLVYVHSSLTSLTRPAPVPVQPTQPPVQQGQPTQPPAPPPSGASCPGFGYTCSQLTCEQAYACLAAGNGKLDRDNDGKPCETQCGG